MYKGADPVPDNNSRELYQACCGSIEEPTHPTLLSPLALAIWLRAYHLRFGCTPGSFSQVLFLTGRWKLLLCWAIKRVIQHPAASKTGKKLPGILLFLCLGSHCAHLSPGLPCSVVASALRANGQPLAGLSLPSCSP